MTTDTWSSTKAKAILSTHPPVPLPTKGPLHALLATTRRSLPSATAINRSEAHEAVDAGAVLVLGQIAHWLQQRPCLELQGPLQATAEESCTWQLVTDSLSQVMAQLDMDVVEEDLYTCKYMTQLEASGGLGSRLHQRDF